MGNPSLAASTKFGSAVSPGSVVVPAFTLADVNSNLIRTSDDGVGGGTSFLGGAVSLIALPSAAYTSSIPSSCTVSTAGITYAALDLTVTSFSGGTSPTIQFLLDRQGADGAWYNVLQSQTFSSGGTNSADLGPGFTNSFSPPNSVQHVVFTSTARLRWNFGGTAPATTVTFSASLVGR